MESNLTAGSLPASPSAPSDHVPVVGAGAVIPFRGARPLSLYATLHRPLVAFPAANDDADPAVGGKLGLAIMLLVAAFIGVLLGIQ